jgi:hypothetical protein
VQEAEGGFREESLVHSGFLDDCSKHLGGFLPIHFEINKMYQSSVLREVVHKEIRELLYILLT